MQINVLILQLDFMWGGKLTKRNLQFEKSKMYSRFMRKVRR